MGELWRVLFLEEEHIDLAKIKRLPYDLTFFTTFYSRMAFKYWIFSLVAFIFFIPSQVEAEQFELMRVARIEIIPENLSLDAAFDAHAVRARMQTKVGSFFSQYEFDNDLKTLADEYDRIDPSIHTVNNEIYISIGIWFKPTIQSISFCGNERISSKKLQKELDISAGSIFDREEFIKAFNKLKILYIKKGYFEAELDYEFIATEGCNAIDIQILIDEGRSGKIKCIEFCGLTHCEESEILEFMVTKKHLFLLSWYTKWGNYHPDMIEHDRLQIINFLQNLGYADAMVDICIEESHKKGKIVVVITVDKGERYYIGNIALCGNTLYSKQEIWDIFQFGRGGVYSPEDIRCTLKAINDLYGGCGYIDTTVDMQVALRADAPIYDVIITIEEGEQYHVGLVKVFGNRYTQTGVILHESILCPGEVFDNRKIAGTEARLCNTGFFSNVNVYGVQSQFEDPCDERLYRDVYIEVEETDTGNIGLFSGFSSLDRIFGGVEITESNFNIAGLTRIFECGPGALRGGGEFAHMKANIGDRQTTYLLQWTKPYFMDTPWIVGFDLEKSNNRALSRGYEIKTYGGTTHSTYIINNFLKYDMHYRARHTRVDVRDTANIALEEQANHSGFVSATGFTFIYDSTDHPRRPTYGFRSRLLYELAGLGGNFQFMKFGYLNTYYYPLSKKAVVKMRADFQFIHPYGSTDRLDIPLSERFFLGGENTVRGYRPFIIGPKFGNNEPAGGISSMLLSEEIQYTLWNCPRLDGFVFVDAGYVSLSEFTLGSPAASVGFGIRIEIMRNMPLMMGLGWPIHPTEKLRRSSGDITLNNAQRFFFSVGGIF